MSMKQMSREDFLSLFSEKVAGNVDAIIRKMYSTHAVCLECLDVASPHKGVRRAALVGPKNTLKTLEQADRVVREADGTVMEPVAFWQIHGGNNA